MTDQPWTPGDATLKIREISRSRELELSYAKHAKKRLAQRGVIISDVLYVLKNGFVYEAPEASTVKGLFKYQIESQSPNSGRRYLRLVVVPDAKSKAIKIVTIMWRDGR